MRLLVCVSVVSLAAGLVGCTPSSGDTDPGPGGMGGGVADSGPADSASGGTDSGPADSGSADADPFDGQLLHVRAADGIDQPGAGGPDQPFATIQHAVDQATPPTRVYIAAGTYTESVIMRPGVSLMGGFSAQDWGDRDVLSRSDPGHQTSVVAALNIAITAGIGVTTEDLIEGLDLHGGIAIHDHHSYGIYLYDGGSPTVRFNTVEGGDGDTYGNGIGLFDSDAHILSNTIRGGDTEITYGIRSGNGSAPLIAGNVIDGDSAADISYGILLNGSSPTIVGNTISGGSPANESYAIFLFANASPEIDSNILMAPGGTIRTCVHEFTVGCRPASLRSNDWYACTTALYRAFGGPGELTDVEGINSLDDTESSGNVALDPQFVSPTDWHLQPSSPPEIRQGGWPSPIAQAAVDHGGAPRTPPWSIGAFELDPR